MQFVAVFTRCIPHTDYSINGFPKLCNTMELPMNGQVVEEKFHLLTPTGEVVDIPIELIKETIGPNVNVAGSVQCWTKYLHGVL